MSNVTPTEIIKTDEKVVDLAQVDVDVDVEAGEQKSKKEEPDLVWGLPPSVPDTFEHGDWPIGDQYVVAYAVIMTLIPMLLCSIWPDVAIFKPIDAHVFVGVVILGWVILPVVNLPFGYLNTYKRVSTGITRKFPHCIKHVILPILLFFLFSDLSEKSRGGIGTALDDEEKEEGEEGAAEDDKIEFGSTEFYTKWFQEATWGSAIQAWVCFMFLTVVRKRYPILNTLFSALNREEDRPWVAWWFVLQTSAASMIGAPMFTYFVNNSKASVFFIVVFGSGIGDAMAEPIGKKWGKKKYTVCALNKTDKPQVRSYVGSAAVAGFTWIGVLLAFAFGGLTWQQFLAGSIAFPIGVSVSEAISPHTFDNHFMEATIFFISWCIFKM